MTLMGYPPPPPPAREPTRESFHLGTARHQYLAGYLTVDEFEQSVWHVLQGGYLRQDGTPALSDQDA